jgi:hypothetical protein
MPAKKNQHFVPKLHLKQFCTNNLINSYDMITKVFRKDIPYESQCQKAYLYGNNLAIENALGPIENHAANIISTILSSKSIPAKPTAEYNALLTYVLFQNCRTLYAREGQQKLLTHFFQSFVKPQMVARGISESDLDGVDMVFTAPFNNLLKQAATAIPLLYDLDCSILINKSSVDFITSDNPCFVINTYTANAPGSIGWAKIGVEIIIPASPDLLIVWADPNVYSISDKLELKSDDTVKSINACIATHCNQNIYYRNLTDAIVLEIGSKVNETGPSDIYSQDYIAAFSANKRLSHMLRGTPKLPSGFTLFPIRSKVTVDREVRDPYLVYLHKKFVDNVEKGIYKASQWVDFLDAEIDE